MLNNISQYTRVKINKKLNILIICKKNLHGNTNVDQLKPKLHRLFQAHTFSHWQNLKSFSCCKVESSLYVATFLLKTSFGIFC